MQNGSDKRRGDWELPGGYIDIHETPELAAIRELYEEANVKIEERQLEQVYIAFDDNERTKIIFTFIAYPVDGVKVILEDGYMNYGWNDLDSEEIPSLQMVNVVRKQIAEINQYIKRKYRP